jgi:glutathione-dependent peroxiredoxin
MKDLYKIYSRTGCSSCLQAKQLLKNKGLYHQYLEFGKDYTMADFIAKSEGQKTFPLIMLGEEKIGTFEDLKKHLQGIEND